MTEQHPISEIPQIGGDAESIAEEQVESMSGDERGDGASHLRSVERSRVEWVPGKIRPGQFERVRAQLAIGPGGSDRMEAAAVFVRMGASAGLGVVLSLVSEEMDFVALMKPAGDFKGDPLITAVDRMRQFPAEPKDLRGN